MLYMLYMPVVAVRTGKHRQQREHREQRDSTLYTYLEKVSSENISTSRKTHTCKTFCKTRNGKPTS